MREVAFEQIVLSLVTWVGWEMGEAEKVVSMKLLGSLCTITQNVS